jgi:flavin reductase
MASYLRNNTMGDSAGNELPETAAKAFKEAMRRLAATVTIVTAAHEGKTYGITMTAVTSLSMEPPTLVICVNRDASLHPVLAGTRDAPFCVNLLHHDHEAAANAFAGTGEREKRFSTGDWQYDKQGTPFLADAQSNLFCTINAALTYASHSIFVGTVNRVRLEGQIAPLLYSNGRYAKLTSG